MTEWIGEHKGLMALVLWLIVLLMAFIADVHVGWVLVAMTLLMSALCFGVLWFVEREDSF